MAYYPPEVIEKVKIRMREMIEQNLPIRKQAYNIDKARELFASQGMEDKEELFWYRRSSYVNVYSLDGYYDYNYGYIKDISDIYTLNQYKKELELLEELLIVPIL